MTREYMIACGIWMFCFGLNALGIMNTGHWINWIFAIYGFFMILAYSSATEWIT